jgi:hypothetical protein
MEVEMSTDSTTAAGQFLVSVGDPEDARPQEEGIAEAEGGPTRGLTIKRLTLNKNYDGRISHAFGGQNEIYFLATSIMFGEEKPFVWPIAPEGAEIAVMELKRGETFEFDLGAGAPLAPERPLTSGLAVAIWIMESDGDRRKAGEKMKAAADAVKGDDSIAKTLAKAITNPAAFTAQQVIETVGLVASVIGAVLSKDQDEHVAFFDAYFGMRESWEGKLESVKEGASIELAELGGEN